MFGVTSLPAEFTDPRHLNYYNNYQRQHWTVENRLPWIRDVAFHGDSSQLRAGATLRALANFRNLLLISKGPGYGGWEGPGRSRR